MRDNDEPGLYLAETWGRNRFFYRTIHSFPETKVSWHWAEYVHKAWYRAKVVPGNLTRSSALQFLLVTGFAFNPDELEIYIQNLKNLYSPICRLEKLE